jgi:predicted nucleotidyltransferase
MPESDFSPLVHDMLDPEIWDGNTMRRSARKALLRIAAEFLISLGVEVRPDDITVTGSMANFNYTPESDLDLHVIMDYSSIDDDLDLVRQMLMAKKSLWNLRHNITIKGHDVEVYPQDASESHHSTGVYSVLRDEWAIQPTRTEPSVDPASVLQKVESLMALIDDTLKRSDRAMHITGLREKLANMRKTGLSNAGEFSVENLAFKELRRMGYLDRLADIERSDRDTSLSVAQEGHRMKILKSELAVILKEELAELDNPRHRGSPDPESRASSNFDPPDDLILGADEDSEHCESETEPYDDGNDMARTVLREVSSLSSKIESGLEGRGDLPDWVDIKLAVALTHLNDIYLYLRGDD